MLETTRQRVRRALPLLIVATLLFDILMIRSVEPVPASRLVLWLLLYFLVTFALISGVYATYAYLNEVAQRGE